MRANDRHNFLIWIYHYFLITLSPDWPLELSLKKKKKIVFVALLLRKANNSLIIANFTTFLWSIKYDTLWFYVKMMLYWSQNLSLLLWKKIKIVKCFCLATFSKIKLQTQVVNLFLEIVFCIHLFPFISSLANQLMWVLGT